MGFNRSDVATLLARCHRRCCICHRFCGIKIETDHIVPAANGGDDTIENAIPVCFDCHAEIHSYNDQHPRGRKFTPDELRTHKRQWLELCDAKPEQLIDNGPRDVEVGPLQALVDEIEFNLAAVKVATTGRAGCPLRDEQFSRAIRTGSISLLVPDLKAAIIDAYVAAGHASTIGQAATVKRAGGLSMSMSGSRSSDPKEAFQTCESLLLEAHRQLLLFLGHDA